jgi:hypothetical protein
MRFCGTQMFFFFSYFWGHRLLQADNVLIQSSCAQLFQKYGSHLTITGATAQNLVAQAIWSPGFMYL